MANIPENLFPNFPETIKNELLNTFNSIQNNYLEHRWEPSELNGGKLCEIVYSIIRGHVDGNIPASATKPRNMVDACKALEQAPSSFPRSIRIQIPRMIIALYEIRNNRGVGHVGGDVDPSNMDATCVLQMSKWIFSELIRIFHNISIDEAVEIVEAISEREVPLIWKINGKMRVLDNSLSMVNKTLLILYQSMGGVKESDLFDSIEHSNPSVYRRDILIKSHKKKLLEYDSTRKMVYISPLGSDIVESKIIGKD